MGTAVEVTNSVEPFDGEGQAGQQPDHQQAVALMVADVFEAVAVLGVVEALFSTSQRNLAIPKMARLLTRRRGKSVSQYASKTVPFGLCCR